MKIKGIQIKNFKSLKDVNIESIGDMNVIIGKNNSGKSNIFQALNLLSINMASYNNVAIGGFNNLGLEDLETHLSLMQQTKQRSNNSLKQEYFFRKNDREPIEMTINMEFSKEEYESVLSYLFEVAKNKLMERGNIGDIKNIERVSNKFRISYNTNDGISEIYEPLFFLLSCNGQPISELAIEKNKEIIKTSGFLKNITYIVKSYKNSLLVEEISTECSSKKIIIHKLKHPNNIAIKLNIVKFCSLMSEDNFNKDNISRYSQVVYEKDYNNHEIKNELFDEHIFFKIYYYFFLNFHNLSANVKIPYERESFTKTELLADDGSDIQKVLSTMHSNNPEMFEEVVKIISKIIPNIKMIRTPFVEGNLTQTQINEDFKNIDFNIQDVGSGLQRAIMIICKVISSKEESIVFIEEPESHLHADAKRKLFDFLKEQSEEKQIFITTHDTIFSSLTNLDNVHLIRKNQEGASTIEKIDDRNIDIIVNELGVKPSDFFEDDKVVFVEGITDVSIFSTVYKKINGTSKINFIDTEGFNNMDYYANAKIIRTKKINIPIFAIFDGDTERKKNKQKTIEELNIPKEHAITLSKNSIENYLLIPRAINAAFSKMPTEEIKIFFEETEEKKNKKYVLDILFKKYGTRYDEENAKKIVEKMNSEELNEIKQEVCDKIISS